MMIPVEFTNKMIASESHIMCYSVYEDDYDVIAVLPPIVQEAFKKHPHDHVVDVLLQAGSAYIRTLYVRLGKMKDATQKSREEAGAILFKKAASGSDTTLVLDVTEKDKEGRDVLMGILLSGWSFDQYRTQKEKVSIQKIVVVCSDPKKFEATFARQQAVVAGIMYARTLTSEPPNVYYPAAYAERVRELSELGIKVEVLDEEALEALGMNSLLAVGKGSSHPSRLVVLQWNGGKKDARPVTVVGKGVCFDSGGLCIKQAIHQHDMKWDKAGAGVVAGLMKTLALTKSTAHVIGIIGLVENMPDGKAMRPGDVIRSASGQTIEIVNTDAEGRLVLADCLWYAQEQFKPKAVIDLGTLTQETFAALGGAYAGLFSNNAMLTEQLKRAGELTGDRVWELPMGKYFAKQIESAVADVRNLGVEENGECGAAAEFLRRFVTCDTWGHLDIAGVSWIVEACPLCPKGVTGFGVRLLEEWIYNEIEKLSQIT